jgi:hypothetical protein
LYLIGHSHWVCVSCDGTGSISVMDSKIEMGINVETVLQLARIYCISSNHSSLQVRRLSVQQQQEHRDCGLLAIAYGVEVCFGKNPEELIFDQQEMRGHLLKCFASKMLLPFPSSSLDTMPRPQRGVLTIKVFCVCKMPSQFDSTMVCCDKCSKWYHCSCVQWELESDQMFLCPMCL